MRTKKKWSDWLYEHLVETGGGMNVHEITEFLLGVRTERAKTPLREIPSKTQISLRLRNDSRFVGEYQKTPNRIGGCSTSYQLRYWRIADGV